MNSTNRIYVCTNNPKYIVQSCLPISDKQLANLAYKFTGNTYCEKHTAEAMLLVNDVQIGKGYNGKLVEIFVK